MTRIIFLVIQVALMRVLSHLQLREAVEGEAPYHLRWLYALPDNPSAKPTWRHTWRREARGATDAGDSFYL